MGLTRRGDGAVVLAKWGDADPGRQRAAAVREAYFDSNLPA